MKKIPLILCIILLLYHYPGIAWAEDHSGKLLTDWINVHLKLVRSTKGVGHVAYSRHFVYSAVAFYESSIAGSKVYHSLTGLVSDLSLKKLPSDAIVPAAAANEAYAAMLVYFYGRNLNHAIIDSTLAANQVLLERSGITKDALLASGTFGKRIAEEVIAWAEMDNSDKANAAYTPPAEIAWWQPTPPAFAKAALPYWQANRPMVAGSTTDVVRTAPPAFSTDPASVYFGMVKEVFDVSQTLTNEQRNIALFWDDSPNGKFLTVPGHWSSILAQVVASNNIPLQKGAAAYACMHLSLYDATIAAWKGKYTYGVVRPVTNIQRLIKKEWMPLIETPPHPEYPAAHATLSSAAATGLTVVLGDRVAFTDQTYSYLGMAPRKFTSFTDAAREAGISRLYGGIHYRFSIEQGLLIGKEVADNVAKAVKLSK